MKRATMFVLSVLLGAQLFAEESSLPQPKSASFEKGAMFTVADYEGSSPLSGFPVLVRIAENFPSGFSYTNLHNGIAADLNDVDIAFVGMDRNGLPYEIDTWNTNGTSLIWVQLPTMTNGTQFVMCWGSNSKGKDVCGTSPWTAYTGVWHLNEVGDVSSDSHVVIHDSTENGLDGTAETGKSVSEGMVGGARRIAEDKAHAPGIVVDVKTDSDKKGLADRLGTDFHASFWMRAKGLVDYANVIGRRTGDNGTSWGLQFNENYGDTPKVMRVFAGSTTKNLTTDDVALGATLSATNNVWKKVDILWKYETNGDTPAADIYLDGSFLESVSLSEAVVQRDANIGIGCSTQVPYYGNEAGGDDKNKKGRRYNGEMDEVRLGAFVPSADWIAADYATQASASFLTAGEAKPYGGTPEPMAGVLVPDVGYTNAMVAVDISSFGTNAGSADVTVQVSTVPDFASAFFSTNYAASVLGECDIPLTGLATGTKYYARAIVVNDKNKSLTTSVASFTTHIPSSPKATAEFFKRGLRSLSAIATVTESGAGQTGSSVRLEASTNGFETIVASAESAAALGTPTSLIVLGLLPMTEYSLRVRVRNEFGIDTYVDVPAQSTCSTPFIASGIGWEFSSDGSALDVYIDITGLREPATGTATLVYSGETVGAKSIADAGRISWPGIGAKSFAAARVVLSATLDGMECSETFSAEIGSGTSGIYIDDIPSHCSADGVLHVCPGDAIVLPSLEEGESYKVLNDSFASISGNVLNALEPGILGVQCIDSASVTNVLPVLILPKRTGNGTIYVFDQMSASALTGGGFQWSDVSSWKRIDGIENTSYPHTAEDTAIIAIYGNAKSPTFLFGSGMETFVGSVYMGRFDDTNPGGIANFTIGTEGDEFIYRRVDGGMPVVRHCQNSTYSGMLLLNGTHKFENADVNVSVGEPSSGLRIGFDGVGKAVFSDCSCDIDSFDIGRGAGTGRVDVVGGNLAARRIILAQDASSVGSIAISNGAVVASAGSVTVGHSGSSVLEVGESGTLTINGGDGLSLSTDKSASYTTNTVLQSGGLIEVKPNFSNNALRDVTLLKEGVIGCCARLQLNGGVMRVLRVKGGDGSHAKDPSKDGVASISANGGTLEAIKEGMFLYDLEHVECGPSGLTVVSDYDITNAVDFVDLDGIPGVLTMKGSGVKTLTGGNTTVSRIVVSGGKVVFAAGARTVSELVLVDGAEVVFEDAPAESGIKKLVLGSHGSFGTIRCTADSTLELACPVEIVSAGIAFGGTFETGRSYTLMTTTGAVDSVSMSAWSVPSYITGLDDSLVYDFSAVKPGGTTVFSVVASVSEDRVEWNGDGETTISTPYNLGKYGVLSVEVGEGATLRLASTVTGGGIVKTGKGRLVLAGSGSTMPRGVTVKDGTLVLEEALALGEPVSAMSGIHMAGGRFLFVGDGSGQGQTLPGGLFGETPSTNDLIDLKIDAPLVVTNAHVANGCIFKRGVGTLTFSPGAGDTMTLSCCDGFIDGNKNVANPGVGDISPVEWVPEKRGYNGFNVAEGEVVFSGGEGALVDIRHCMSVGIWASGIGKAPSLVVDGVSANLSSVGQFNFCSRIGNDSSSLSKFARLEIVNGARVASQSMRSGVDVLYSSPTVIVERATWSVANSLLPYGSSDGSNATFIMRDGAAVYVNGGNVNYRMESWGGNRHKIHIDGSVLAGDSVFGGMQMRATGYSVSVVNGGVLSTWRMREKESKFVLDLSFDGGTWIADAGKWQPMKFMHATNVVIRTKGADGLTFPVEAGYTVEATQAVTGEGGMTKTGGGTYVFCRRATWYAEDADNENQGKWQKDLLDDPVTLAFEGTLDVQGGDVLVESGACRIGGAYNAAEGASVDFGGNDLGEGVMFSGGGKLSNFTATAPTISVPLSESLVATNGAPWFLSAAISGPVLVDFGSPVANARGGQVAVAKFADSIPSVSSWLMTGVPKGFAASLGVSGSSVVADIHRTGFTIRLK